MRNSFIARTIVCCALIAQAGCFKLGRNAPVLQQYVLEGGGAKADATAPQRVGGTMIGVRRLDLATYLASPAIVVRRGGHEIVISEFHRWGEDPIEGISRALASHLAATPSVGAVDVAPWAARAPHDFLVQLHVGRFEGVADETATTGEAQMLATWEIIRPDDGAVLARGSTDYRERGWEVGNYAALVKLLNGALQNVSIDVMTCIARLSPATPRSAGRLEPAGTLACSRGA